LKSRLPHLRASPSTKFATPVLEIYVVAEAGKRFELRYRADPRSFLPLPRGNEYHFSGKIDGRCLGTRMIIDSVRNTGKQVGFARHGDATGVTYDLFKFAPAVANEAVQANLYTEFQEGKVELTVQEYQPVSGFFEHKASQLNKASKVPSLPEGS